MRLLVAGKLRRSGTGRRSPANVSMTMLRHTVAVANQSSGGRLKTWSFVVRRKGRPADRHSALLGEDADES